MAAVTDTKRADTCAAIEINRRCLTCCGDISDRPNNARRCQTCAAYRRRGARGGGVGIPTIRTECGHCGEPFPEPTWRQFCSRTCQAGNAASKRFQVAEIKTCTACGETFTTTNSRRNECSRTCVQWRYLHPDVPRILDKECQRCLTPFSTWTAKQKYCCSSCCLAAARMRREARKARNFVEEVSKGIVAKRDKWQCQLCGKKVNSGLVYPHPMSWSLDHVIPIARGGEHSYANSQLAHLLCNSRKHATIRGPQQLALIG